MIELVGSAALLGWSGTCGWGITVRLARLSCSGTVVGLLWREMLRRLIGLLVVLLEAASVGSGRLIVRGLLLMRLVLVRRLGRYTRWYVFALCGWRV